MADSYYEHREDSHMSLIITFEHSYLSRNFYAANHVASFLLRVTCAGIIF